MDLDVITDGWPYDEADETGNVRKIVGIDGCLKLQVRIRSGVVQWEADGRPDGLQPYGCESMLQYCLQRCNPDPDSDSGGSNNPDAPSYCLSDEELVELDGELFDYQRRMQAFLILGDYERAIRDANHNLQILDIIRDHAGNLATGRFYDRKRPMLIGDRARAMAFLEIERRQIKRAILVLTRGIEDIESFYRRSATNLKMEECHDRRTLIEFRRSLRERYQVPLTDGELLQTLRAEQRVAINRENYEMAAELRDKITALCSRVHSRGADAENEW
jgi:hypothetical protein